jgi:hypothetical protein
VRRLRRGRRHRLSEQHPDDPATAWSPTRIAGDTTRAFSPAATANAYGGGLQAGGSLTLRNVTVDRNSANATGLTGHARGGGIFATLFPPVDLRLGSSIAQVMTPWRRASTLKYAAIRRGR